MTTPPLRCAIYTRKSSEEGLEQGFNSLHAQREACEAYVLSQTGEGWAGLPKLYDDGGFSGGSMNRPGVQALLEDVRQGRVDIVVVYKVDRLTRSLADFARIIELFDQHKVSFVSVTQSFNTTSSMGRLTLNVLLSFAQFERDVTGERIRDKIAHSKAKGMWMGGRPPLGYNGCERKLVVNPAEAARVTGLFERYLRAGSIQKVREDLRLVGAVSKVWLAKDGRTLGGAPFSRGALYYLLSNPVYRGVIRHKDKSYPGAHPAIVPDALWDAVQAQLAANSAAHPTTRRVGSEILLKGLLFDDRGESMSVTHGNRRGRRYRYYVSAPSQRKTTRQAGSLDRIAMGVLDSFVISAVEGFLAEGWMPDAPLRDRVKRGLKRVVLGSEQVGLFVINEATVAKPNLAEGVVLRHGREIEFSIPIRLKHRQGATVLIANETLASRQPKLDRALIRAVALSHLWATSLASGAETTIKAIALKNGFCEHYAARLMPLAWLAPDLVDQILAGGQPPALTLSALMSATLPVDWTAQRRLFATFG